MEEIFKVLVVDDDEVDRMAVKRALRIASVQVELSEASSCASAIAALQQQAFDCVLLDYLLPDGDGLDLIQAIRTAGISTALVVLTGQGDEQIAVQLMKAGAADYLSKATVSPHTLGRILHNAIRLHRAELGAAIANQRLRESEEGFRFLAEASNILATSLDYQTTLHNVAHLIVPKLADLCVVTTPHEQDSHQAAATQGNPAQVNLLLEIAGCPPHLLHDLKTPFAKVLLTHEPETFTPNACTGWTVEQTHVYLTQLRAQQIQAIAYVPLVARGRMLGLIVLGRKACSSYSSTELVLLEELAHRAALALDNARLYQEAQEASQLKDEFLTTLSHELRTPLHVMLGCTQLLRARKYNEAITARALETIERNARLQTQLLKDIFDASRLVKGQLSLKVQPVELIPVIEAAIAVVRPMAKAKEIQLISQLSPVANLVLGDASRLQQVLWNLLSNAIKFTPSGGQVTVGLSLVSPLSISADKQCDPQVQIQVSDTGQGIRAEFLPYVFDRFRQADSSMTRTHNGLGLGLAIARQLVELHGGSIAVESPGEGQGATFTVRLPFRESVPEANQAATQWSSAIADLAG